MDDVAVSPVENCDHNEDEPRIGMKFKSVDEAYDFYNRYGQTVGFSVRKDTQHRSQKDKTIIVQRRYTCSKAGFRRDIRDKMTKEPRPDTGTFFIKTETRTGCPAKMCISRLDDGQYECRDFIEHHNHFLHTKETAHLMRSQRRIFNSQANELKAVGKEDLDTKQDLLYVLPTKRQRHLAYGEAGSLLAYFESQRRLDPTFIYSMQLDNEGRITNVFWADFKMIIDYGLFGDVVIFDTTFCTNKEYRPFGVFMGFNHHRGTIIFGAALFYDETIESFKWLFGKFLETNGQKKPKTIFTDQNVAMAMAIAEVLPDTRHGLCNWHIMQNGIKHLGNLMKQGSTFLKDVTKCIYEYEDVEEFENAWKSLRNDYQIDNTLWLDEMYGIKETWAHCYMKYAFALDVRSSKLSESINSDLKDDLKLNNELLRFLSHFEQVVKDKRANELKDEFDARNTLPMSSHSKIPMLRQACKIYTPYILEHFLKEYELMCACVFKSQNTNGLYGEYVVSLVDEQGDYIGGESKVLYNPSDQTVTCSCRKFEIFGILCGHALKVLDFLQIKCIPDKYILMRWTRTARSLSMDDKKGKEVNQVDGQLNRIQRYDILRPKFLKLIHQACKSEDGYKLACSNADMLFKQLVELDVEESDQDVSSRSIEAYESPVLKKNEGKKGGSKRHKPSQDGIGNKKNNSNKTMEGDNSIDVRSSGLPSSMSTWDFHDGYEDMGQSDFMSPLQQRGTSQSSTSGVIPS